MKILFIILLVLGLLDRSWGVILNITIWVVGVVTVFNWLFGA